MNSIDDQLSESDEETEALQTNESIANTAQIRVNFGDEKSATIVCNSLIVDKEPKRSSAIRNLSVDGAFIVADIKCPDAKYLQKSADNFFEMCELSRSVIQRVGAYKYKKAPTISTKNTCKSKSKKAT